MRLMIMMHSKVIGLASPANAVTTNPLIERVFQPYSAWSLIKRKPHVQTQHRRKYLCLPNR